MKPQRLLAMLSLLVAFVAFVPVAAQNTSKRPMTVDDILAFRAMGATALSQNGQWFAYRVAPQVGDGEVIVRSTTGDKEMKFPVGEGAGTMSFSEDGAYIGISVGLPRRQAQAAQRANQPVQNSLLLVNLATGEKTSIPKIRRFSFNGEMGGWVALDRYPPTPAAAGGAAPAAAAGGGRGGGGGGRGGANAAPAPPRWGDLKVETSHMKPGYVRKNGVPYSENATLLEYYDRHKEPNGDEWLTVTTILHDPKYYMQDFITSTHFKKETDQSKWRPMPCTAS